MRPSKDEYWLALVKDARLRGTCPRRQCAAIIVDSENNIISSGYNGSPRGLPHCIDEPCPGSKDNSGDYHQCIAVHAEANSIIQAGDRLKHGVIMYCTTRPCFDCSKLICQTKIQKIVYLEDYPDERGLNLLLAKGITLELYKEV